LNAPRIVTEKPASMTQPDQSTDLRLIALVADGDMPAFRELYGRYHPRLTRFLLNVVRRPQIVEEVLDDTLMVVWERARTFKGESKLSTWIFAIAYRKAMKAMRRLDEPVEDHGAETRASDAVGPDEEWGRKRLHEVIRSAMLKLSPEHCAVVDLTYYHELGYREIAEILDCPVDTVKTRMFYARRHLKRALEGELPDWV
jgi:RNA polymerase sigma factor (sigma-70 family)